MGLSASMVAVQVKAETGGFVQLFHFDKSILELVNLDDVDQRGHFE
jgi:hypothetical protein